MHALTAVGALIAVLALEGCGSGQRTATPVRARPPFSMLEEYAALKAQPARTLQTLRSLGVGAILVFIEWKQVAADPGSRLAPAGDAYPESGFGWYDKVDRDARANGIEVDFLLSSGAPRWAIGRGDPANDPYPGAWSPDPKAYEGFFEAVGRRYSGHYTPPGASSPLPRVHFWEVWSEPNWGPSLEPQLALHPYRILAALEYRRLADAAWSALRVTGHAHDTVVLGNLSPRGTAQIPASPQAAASGISGPVSFTRALYCVGPSYRPLQGNAAIQAGCPPDAAGARAFSRAHPGLFGATGYGIHPYPVNLPPNKADNTDPNSDTVEFSQIPRLASVLDRIDRVYGSDRQMNIYNTEYGYITNPPNPYPEYLSPAKAAVYLNWAEYLTWRNPRIENSMQYGLYDANIPHSVFGPGGFSSSLISYTGKPKATFYAYRMPIFMPVTRAPSGHALELWGCARPAPYAYLDTHRTQYVGVQFRPRAGRRFRTLRTVGLTAAGGCYFDVGVTFPSSGTVRLQWSYPHGDQRLFDPAAPGDTTIYSRQVSITIR